MSSRSVSLALLGLAVATLPACIDSDIQAKLASDGSGTMSMRMGLTEGMVAVLEQLKEIDPESDVIEETNEIMFSEPDAEKRAAMKAAGCEILAFEGEQSDTKVFSRFEVAFTHLSTLTELDQIRPEGSDPGEGPGQEMMLVRNDDGTYTLSMSGPGDDDDDDEFEDEDPFAEDDDGDDEGEDEAEEDGETDPAEEMRKAAAAMELMGKLMAEASKLKIVVGIEVPGEVVSHTPTTAATVEGSKVTWTMDMASMMASDTESSGMDSGFSVTFKMPEGEALPESALHQRATTEK